MAASPQGLLRFFTFIHGHKNFHTITSQLILVPVFGFPWKSDADAGPTG
jgi:hypothetical protein